MSRYAKMAFCMGFIERKNTIWATEITVRYPVSGSHFSHHWGEQPATWKSKTKVPH